jgi:hypothetical protein
MTKGQMTVGLSALLPLVATGVFVVFGGLLAPPVRANDGGTCDPGICQKNGCTEKSQYCKADGSGWLACGTC